MERKSTRVCVTGGAGFIGSWLVKMLLARGYTVHATLRNLDDELKVGLLKSLPGAETRLELFAADMYDSETFKASIRGCEFVFLVATPYLPQHCPQISKYKDSIEATVDSVRIVMRLCEESGTVKRLVYTGSVTAASPLKEDGTEFKEFIDESCWTPLHLPFDHAEELNKAYVIAKTLSEKEILSYNDKPDTTMEVVSLACALVGGNTVLGDVPITVRAVASPVHDNPICHKQLRFLNALLGSVPLVHVDDVCEAHVFCIEQPKMTGRFLCASAYPSLNELLDCYENMYPNKLRMIRMDDDHKVGVPYISAKLETLGFKYKYALKQIVDENMKCMEKQTIGTSFVPPYAKK